jgi:hypothetical protein
MSLSKVEALTPSQIRAAKEVNDVVVLHESLIRILNDAIGMATMMQEVRMPAGILIQANPGMGKSMLLKLIQRELESRSKGINQDRPCLSIQLDSAVDTIRIAGLMTLALGYPMLPSRGKQDALNNMIQKSMERLRPLLLTIDETQHICEGNKAITARSVTDWLKVRMDAYNLPVVCVGTQAMEKLCSINPQFTSRASANYVIEPFAFNGAWERLLEGFCQPVKEVDLTIITKGASKKLHAATSGNLRALKRILVLGAVAASAREDRCLRMPDLEAAFERHAGAQFSGPNPFTPKEKEAVRDGA